LLTKSFASRFQLRLAQPFLAKIKWTKYWLLYPQWLKCMFSSFVKNESENEDTKKEKALGFCHLRDILFFIINYDYDLARETSGRAD
jgi:hypothetical protein